MRIALVTREFPPDTAWGGIGAFYGHYARTLARAGCDVEVFCQSIGAERTEAIDGLTVHHVLVRPPGADAGVPEALAGLSDLGAFARSLAAGMCAAVTVRHAIAPFDIIEGHEHLGINALINAAQLERARTITRYHTAYESLVSRRLVDWPDAPAIGALEQQAVHHADFRIATSRFIDRVTREDFGAPAADATIFNLVADMPHPMQAPPARENVIAFVGRLVLGHKRPDLVVQAFAQLARRHPDWRCEIAGPDMSHHDGASVWRYCEDLLPPELRGRVHYHGALAPEAVRNLYQRAKILAAPSRFESFGMVALEAMREGCVPVVADDTALTDVVADPELAFRNGDAGDLARVLDRLMGHPLLLETKAARSAARAAAAFDEDMLIAQNLAAYRAALTRPARSALAAKPLPPVHGPLVSIVVPSYNQGPFIAETIRSILDQDYPHKEVIVVDGGSTDNTLQVLRSFSEIRWVSQKDKGQTHAINKGLLASRGEIVAYLNSDDIYRPGALRAVVDVFQSEPDTRIVVGNCDYIDGASKIIGHLKARCDSIQDLVRYWGWERWFCVPQQAVFWRRSLMSEVGLFNTSLHMVMDFEYWLRANLITKFRVLDATLAAFRLTAGTKTISRTHEMYLEEYETFRRFRHVLAPWPRFKASLAARRHYARKQIMMAQHYLLAAHLRRLSFRLIGSALKKWPLYALRSEVLLCAGHLALSTIAPMPKLERAHRFALRVAPGWR
jgi:glycosyltransferase involved in cell wall biosynthesis